MASALVEVFILQKWFYFLHWREKDGKNFCELLKLSLKYGHKYGLADIEYVCYGYYTEIETN